MKKYNNNWYAKKLTINFNHKQWRQDFAAFVREKKYWDAAKVTRSKAISNNPADKGVKSFEVYNGYGGKIIVIYHNDNEIISSTHDDLVKQYFEIRGLS